MDIDLSFVKNEFFLTTLAEYLNKLFQINKKIKGIVLFGSLARNEEIYSEEKVSDIDIIVIFSDNELPNDPIDRINHEIKLMELSASGIESIWMTETEFRNAVKIKRDIILSGLYEGKILFDPDNLIKDQKDKLFKELKEKGVVKRKDYWIWPLKYLGEEIEW